MDTIDHVPTDEEKLQRAIEHGGYKEEPLPTRDERAHALVAALEHAVENNAPVTNVMVAEVRELLEVPMPSQVPAAPVEG